MLRLVKVIGEHERGVRFRLGRLLDKSVGPGRVWTIPTVDRLVVVDMLATTIDVPPVEVMTKDGVPLSVIAQVDAQVVSPTDAVVRVEAQEPARGHEPAATAVGNGGRDGEVGKGAVDGPGASRDEDHASTARRELLRRAGLNDH